MLTDNSIKNRLAHAEVLDWGLIDYAQALSKQEQIFEQCLQAKLAGENTRDYFIFCEHKPVFTLGRGGDKAHLLVDEAVLARQGISFFPTTRGGDITFHGPGQLVCYPILNLQAYKTDVRWYVRNLEEAVIRTLAEFAIVAERAQGFPGVWLEAEEPARARKICAIGVRMSRWQTMHGLALNIKPNLEYFQHIIPCGIQNKQVTSMQEELGANCPDLQAVKQSLLCNLRAVLAEI